LGVIVVFNELCYGVICILHGSFSLIDIASYFFVIVIFYCANKTAFHMPDWKFSEGGRCVKLGLKMGRCRKKRWKLL